MPNGFGPRTTRPSQSTQEMLPGLPMGPRGGFATGASPQVYTPAYAIPHYEETRGQLGDIRQQFGEQYAPLLDMLGAQARGEGPTIAQGQLQQATDRNIAQAMALGASQAGYQPSSAVQRAVGEQSAQARQEMAGQSGILRAQEMMAARQAMADAISQQAQVESGLLGQIGGLDITQAGMSQALQQLLAQSFQQQSQIMNQPQPGGFMESLMTSLGSSIGGMFSDEKLKKNIVENEEDIQEFLDFLGGHNA